MRISTWCRAVVGTTQHETPGASPHETREGCRTRFNHFYELFCYPSHIWGANAQCHGSFRIDEDELMAKMG
jgi:hypothetical protein